MSITAAFELSDARDWLRRKNGVYEKYDSTATTPQFHVCATAILRQESTCNAMTMCEKVWKVYIASFTHSRSIFSPPGSLAKQNDL
jgi:hypothetical protein